MNGLAPVHQMLPNFAYGDAIGNEVLTLRGLLRGLGHESEIFAGVTGPRLAGQAHEHLRYRDYSRPDAILIYHFSVGSELAAYVAGLPDRLVVLYHNVTPPRWFEGVSPHMVELSVRGEQELAALAPRAAAAWADSSFNAAQMAALGYPTPSVLPIVARFERFDGPGDPVVRQLWRRPGVKTWLFVGRVSPNKRHEDLIRAFAAYSRWGSGRGRLICVGDYANCARYHHGLRDLARRLRVADVHFTGLVPFDELLAYYRIADIFVSLSRHEGFCVPLLEAMHAGLPVLAYAAAAVPETLDGAGVLARTDDPLLLAEMADRLLHDAELRARVLAGQRARLARYLGLDVAGRLAALIAGVP